jgi:hypothetical protein
MFIEAGFKHSEAPAERNQFASLRRTSRSFGAEELSSVTSAINIWPLCGPARFVLEP